MDSFTKYGMDILQMVIYLAVLLLCAKPLGEFMAKVYTGKATFLDRVIGPGERWIYRILKIDPEEEMNWKEYAKALLIFNLLGIFLTFLIQVFQGFFPWNPQNLSGVSPWLAFNTAVSFVTNTNWQAYGGETTMSYFTQMAGLAVHNFLSAATGIAVVVALARGLGRRSAATIGNYWTDLTKSVLYVLLPLSLIGALVLVSQGVIQNLSPYLHLTTVEGIKQSIAMGPAASQEIIKELGTNGGGFLNANSAHPFENPTPFTNFIEILAILVIPAGLTVTFGRMVGDTKQGRSILTAMVVLFLCTLAGCYAAEIMGNPQVSALEIQGPSALEGKEVRFGVGNSALFATVTTAASCGAVNSMHDSFTPLGGLMPMLQIMLGEVIFGGVGSGLYGMLIFAILAVFLVGLMVGRTPEYLGKKIESWEMKMAVLAILIPAATILIGSSVAAVIKPGVSSILNPGPHGLSEILYAYSSTAGNNGSAFAGLSVNTPFYNGTLALAMLLGRFGVILPVLAVAGSMVGKKTVAAGPGTFRTDTLFFAVMLMITVLIVGALTFLPALALGPLVEHLLLFAGKVF
ncbi:potassium-transporting ATPase subunit KdpA [Candidatus Formimonas warabiya]|nr:potassium-transporting ATPase subunit KdpA [Candidatus Formimonas warabiya]